MSMHPENSPLETPGDVERIPLIEEQVRVKRQVVETGGVQVHKGVETRHETIEQTLAREEVEVKRVAVGREVDRTEPPREVDGVTIVPVYEEELVVRKRLILKEELHISRHRTERVESIPVALRKEHATVERRQAPPPEDATE